MPDLTLRFAKIVSTPSQTSWSQAYNAGKLFAVLSLTRKTQEETDTPLGLVGKEILEVLEQEYFTLEEKNLTSVKDAIAKTYEKTPEDITICFVVSSIVNNVLYVFTVGKGAVFLKRSEKLGNIIEGSADRETKAASGFLEDNDRVILQTEQFFNLVPPDVLSESLNNNPPTETAEALSPRIHNSQEGGAAAIIIAYNKEQIDAQEISKIPSKEQAPSKDQMQKKPLFSILSRISIPNLPSLSLIKLPKSKIFLLGIVSICIIALLAGGIFVVKQRENAKNERLANEIIKEAQKKYDEGIALSGLNKALAREDFVKAADILKEGKTRLPDNAAQQKELDSFLKKIDDSLASSTNENRVTPIEQKEASTPFLDYIKKNSQAQITTQNETTIYSLENETIFSIDKASQKKESLTKNDWESPIALGVFLRNLYVLDGKKNEIHKLTPSGNTYAASPYLKDNTGITLTNASSMGIDGSIYVLLKDGTIYKFTKGEKEPFALSGLDTPLKDPFRIVTNADTENLYILDKGNSRIVVFSKNGAYQSQYNTDIFKEAKEIDVSEKDKTIFILSKNLVWKIETR